MYDHIHELFPELERDLLSYTTGILPSQKIRELIENGSVKASAPIKEEQIQPSSLDLRLGAIAYRVQSSFLPGPNSTVETTAKDLIMTEHALTRPTALEKASMFLIPLM